MGKLAVFADAQTAQLDKANDRADTAIAITDNCQAMEERVRQALSPPPSLWSRVRAAWPF